MDCNRKYIFPSFIYNTLLEHLRPIHNPLQGYDICQEKKKTTLQEQATKVFPEASCWDL